MAIGMLLSIKKNKDYPLYIRNKDSVNAKEEILFDCNVLAKDHEYFNLSNIQISPNNKYAAFSIDTVLEGYTL